MERDELGKFLRKKRESKNLSLRKLERLSKELRETELTYSHISKIENGEVSPSLQTLQKIAAVLQLPFVVVFDGKVSPLNEVTVISTSEFSQLLFSALSREEMIQLMILCQNLSAEQLNILVSLAKSLPQSSSNQDEQSPP